MYITNLCCGNAAELPSWQTPPHLAGCKILVGWRWACSCAGAYCEDNCDGKLVPPKDESE